MISSKTTIQPQEISLLEALSEASYVKGVLSQVPESMDLNSASSIVSVQSENSHFSTLMSDTFMSYGFPDSKGLSDILSPVHKAPDIPAGLEACAAGGDVSSILNPGTVIVAYINTVKTTLDFYQACKQDGYIYNMETERNCQ